MKSLVDFTDERFFKRLKSKNKFSAIEELALVYKDTGVCTDINELVLALKERESIMSTGIGLGLAIPHAKIKSVNNLAFAIGISKKGIPFESIDNEPVYLLILVAAGDKQHKEYLKLLSSIMAVLKREEIRKKIINSKSAKEIIECFQGQTIL